jgi:hypothetical protein
VEEDFRHQFQFPNSHGYNGVLPGLNEVPQVVIRGGGVAAYCCAHLLKQANVADAGLGVPAILIGEGTQSLLMDVFERRDLFVGLPRIDKRIVAWGPGAALKVLPHAAVVVSEFELIERLRSESLLEVPDADAPAWTIYAGRKSHPDAQERAFGSRRAAVMRVKLRERTDRAACWIESLEEGWMFLIPGDGEGWLLAVGGSVEEMLGVSRVVGAEIQKVSTCLGEFAAFPRISDPLGGAEWLACGTAAMGFDPICGDGVGNAVREAILAAAVVRGGGSEELVAHYRMRLLAGFARHLEQCLPFYDCGHAGPWWTAERESLREGIEWCRARLAEAGPFRFRLAGFELERL